MMTKGFVTIATGSDYYYKLAYNLALSYRFFNKSSLPFAIICDRENQYTKIFDKVIILDKPTFSYIDKLRLPEFQIFDQNIFLDADSLVYGDITNLFAVFDNEVIFSALGHKRELSYQKAWFTYDGAGEFKDKISYLVSLHGGAYFYEKCKRTSRFGETCAYILKKYNEFSFITNSPCDEAIIALAMSVCNLSPIENQSIGKYFTFPGHSKTAKKTKVCPKINPDGCRIVHFGNIHTYSPKYKYDIYLIKDNFANRTPKKMFLNRIAWLIQYRIKLIPFYWKIIVNKYFK